jgi:membrane-associated phospholipid phosphatase
VSRSSSALWADLRRTAEGLRARFELSSNAVALLAAAVVVLAAASAVLAKVGEDVIAHDGLATRDASNLQTVAGDRTAWLVDAARYATRSGSIVLLLIAAVAIGVILWMRRAPFVVAVTPLAALLTTGAIVAVVKQLVGRARPPLGLRLVTETEPSFPSGHSADSAALFVAAGIVVAAVLLHRPLLRALAVAAGFVVSGAIGLSRIVLGAHWPTDVLAGWSLGTIVAIAVSATVLVAVRAEPGAEPTAKHRFAGHALAALRWQRPTHHLSSAR